MPERLAKPTFLVACTCNLAFAAFGGLSIEDYHLATRLLTIFGGGLSFVVAATLAFIILQQHQGMHRPWVKAALVFLVLGPIAFWGIQWPAAVDSICVAGHRCYSEAAITFQMRVMGDVIQSQWAMIAVALAALLCATRATTVTLDELAA